MSEGTLVPVGRVGRPHGRDGSFVVEQASDEADRFAAGSILFVDGAPATVLLTRRVGGGRRAIRLDRQVPRGATLAVSRESLPPPEADSYYVSDLVGLRVIEDGGDELGRVCDVVPGPANDALVLDDGHLLPMVEACVLEIDLDAGTIAVARGFRRDG